MPFMKRFRAANKDGDWTRRGAIAAVASLAACSNPPIAHPPEGDHPLWPRSGPPVLRGAVIAQRRRRLDVDGTSFGGGGPALPAYGRADFDALAAAGANLVVMSFPELWTVGPRWRRDQKMADLLDRQLDDARAAGLFVVVALRSGPGRSDFVFHRDAAGSWFSENLIVDSIWREDAPQAAWTEMCVDAARLLKGRPEVAGLNIMVEPEPNVGGLNLEGGRLGAWSPEAYVAQVSPISDWRRLAGDIARKVRAVSSDLPILISPPAFARTDFLPVMGAAPVSNTVWCVHDYEPREFTHHSKGSAGIANFSEDGDSTFVHRVDRIMPLDAPLFLGEFGASRWASGVNDYYKSRVAACDERGVAWAAFRWPTRDADYEAADEMFNFSLGDTRDEPAAIETLRAAWAHNTRRPKAVRLRGRS
jgi:Cellulase (glycosyl hydrolase family 5)